MPAAPANPGEKTAHRGVHGAWGKGSACVCCLAPLWCNWGHKRLAGDFPETSKKLSQWQPARRPPWVGGGPLRQPLPPWPTSGAVPPCKACRQPLVPGLVWAGWHEASPLNRATLAVFGGGGGGPECPPGRPRVGPLCHSPPWPPLARPRATGGKGRGLGWPWGCSV